MYLGARCLNKTIHQGIRANEITDPHDFHPSGQQRQIGYIKLNHQPITFSGINSKYKTKCQFSYKLLK